MDRVLAALPIILVVAVVFAGLAIAWRRRHRVTATLTLPEAPEELGDELARVDALYAGTTRADDPLERVTAAGLGFRARAVVTVATAGVRLDLAGVEPITLPVSALRGAGTAAWTLDKGVGRDGLAVLRWELDGLEVESSFRTPERDALLAAFQTIVPPGSAPDGPAQEVA